MLLLRLALPSSLMRKQELKKIEKEQKKECPGEQNEYVQQVWVKHLVVSEVCLSCFL